MTNREAEFAVLRYTIATRGTVRAVLVVATVVCWAIVASLHALFSDLPLTTVIPLVVLCAGYEVVWGLHVGIERVGRFLQVRYEAADAPPTGPSWETTVMAAAPGLPGFGANPLASWVFGVADLVNLGGAFISEPTGVEVLLLVVCHVAFLSRIVYTRARATTQRVADLTAFSDVVSPSASRDVAGETSPNHKNS